LSEIGSALTVNGATYSSDNGGCYVFDNDIIDTTFPATTIPTSTLEAVIYPTVNGRYVAIIQINSNSDDALYIYPGNTLGFWPHSASSLSVNINQWSYVCASYDGSGVRYCVNGNFAYAAGASADFTDYQYLRIGGISTTDGERFVGKISLAKAYNRALTESEIIQNFNALRGRFGI
jgi:hypothetical protein